MTREEAEADTMAIHDRESLQLMIYERALCTVGRIVLGYKGRKIARERRRQVRLEEVYMHTTWATAGPAAATILFSRFSECLDFRPRHL